MNFVDRVIAGFSPQRALARMQARVALQRISAHYEAASVSKRTGHRRAPGTDADAAGSTRRRVANVARDMVRNTPFAARIQQVIANNVVGDGIIPKVRLPGNLSKAGAARLRDGVLGLIERDLDTTFIDADGRQNLYGLQRLAMNAIVDAGEVLVVRTSARGHRLQVRLLEIDYLDDSRQGADEAGGWVKDGIEYDEAGVRVAYWLFDQHPGASNWGKPGSPISRRVPAADVLHIYRQDRPGQMRGVSWFSSIAIPLQDLGEFQDAQLMRQKIAACFVAFRRVESLGEGDARSAELESLSPGLVQDIGPDEEVTFGTPPDSGDFDPFSRSILRAVAAGVGVTYEAATGDLSMVNFSSARMGRVEMDRNVSSWQWTMLIPQMLQPMGRWLMEGWQTDLAEMGVGDAGLAMLRFGIGFEWVPPYKVLVDPTREIPALIEGIRGGLFSLSGVVRSLGHDPERLFEDIAADNAALDALGLRFESDFRTSADGAPRTARPDSSDDAADRQAKPKARAKPPSPAKPRARALFAAPRQTFKGV